MSVETLLSVSGTVFYIIASAMAVLSFVRIDSRRDKAGLMCLVMGSIILSAALALRVVKAGGVPSFNRFDGLACYVLGLSVVYLLVNTHRSTRGVAGLLFPFLAFILLCGITAQGVDPGPLPAPQNPWLVLHVVVGYAAYAVFSLASLNAAAYLLQDYNMKHKHFGRVWEKLPSLETLDHLMSRLVGLSFLLLTISVILGCALIHQTGGSDRWITDPKVAAVSAVWILFAVLVHMRASADRHGRGVAILTVGGLALVLFAFVGVHFVADTLHAFLKVHRGVAGL
ncbi:MAG: cytochrome c biogenesis protein CcsA [bacterium]